jgi:hypothetical protein
MNCPRCSVSCLRVNGKNGETDVAYCPSCYQMVKECAKCQNYGRLLSKFCSKCNAKQDAPPDAWPMAHCNASRNAYRLTSDYQFPTPRYTRRFKVPDMHQISSMVLAGGILFVPDPRETCYHLYNPLGDTLKPIHGISDDTPHSRIECASVSCFSSTPVIHDYHLFFATPSTIVRINLEVTQREEILHDEKIILPRHCAPLVVCTELEGVKREATLVFGCKNHLLIMNTLHKPEYRFVELLNLNNGEEIRTPCVYQNSQIVVTTSQGKLFTFDLFDENVSQVEAVFTSNASFSAPTALEDCIIFEELDLQNRTRNAISYSPQKTVKMSRFDLFKVTLRKKFNDVYEAKQKYPPLSDGKRVIFTDDLGKEIGLSSGGALTSRAHTSSSLMTHQAIWVGDEVFFVSDTRWGRLNLKTMWADTLPLGNSANDQVYGIAQPIIVGNNLYVLCLDRVISKSIV